MRVLVYVCLSPRCTPSPRRLRANEQSPKTAEGQGYSNLLQSDVDIGEDALTDEEVRLAFATVYSAARREVLSQSVGVALQHFFHYPWCKYGAAERKRNT